MCVRTDLHVTTMQGHPHFSEGATEAQRDMTLPRVTAGQGQR